MSKYTIATLGGHSALEIASGAKKFGYKTLVIVQKGREKTYANYFPHLADEIIYVDKFSELTSERVTGKLISANSIFIPHRYCQVYCDLDALEDNFPVKIFGNKHLLRYEERQGKYHQYLILKKAGVYYPVQFDNSRDINTLCIVKVKEAVRGYERAFFFAGNYSEFKINSKRLISTGKIREEDLKDAVIEEYIVGAQVNFNFFYSPIKKRLELLGTDMRRQTNIDGYLRLPGFIQEEIRSYLNPSYIETGHIAVTVKESLLEEAYVIAEKILKAAKEIEPPGIVGPFALQTAISAGPPKEKIIIYDLSLRMPGSPGISYTPYSKYLFGENVSFGERIAMEIQEADRICGINKITS